MGIDFHAEGGVHVSPVLLNTNGAYLTANTLKACDSLSIRCKETKHKTEMSEGRPNVHPHVETSGGPLCSIYIHQM